jgi:aryl-alcohol dehydrogenase-like predicted oxidoreductase
VTAIAYIGDTAVSRVALGATGWSFTDLPIWRETINTRRSADEVDDDLGVRTIHTALDFGIRIIDTARAYTRADHPGHSEALIARALATHPAGTEVLIATKGGHYRDGENFPIDGRPDTIRRHCEMSLECLGVDRLDLFQLHYPDPNVALGTTMSAFAALKTEGLIRYVGLSNVSIDELREAQDVVEIASIQNHFSPFNQDDRPMLAYCEEHSIAYLAAYPLGGIGISRERGWVGGLGSAFPAATEVAERRGVSIQRLALAWLSQLSPVIIPICGAGRPDTIRDSAQASALVLSNDELLALDF